jgi:hypothetical protein
MALGGVEETGGRILAWFGGLHGEEKPMPALAEGRRGRGRVLLFASGPTNTWGDLFREPVFVPFIHEAVAYLARSEPARLSVLAGERLTVKLHPSERGCRARLEDRSVKPPLARELAIDSERLEVPLGRLRSRGVFHVVTSDPSGGAAAGRRGPRERAVAVELDPREFSHERADPADLFGRRARLSRSSEELSSAFARTRGGAEVTGYVAWATLVAFLAEMLLSARLTRRRSVSQGHAANVRGAI